MCVCVCVIVLNDINFITEKTSKIKLPISKAPILRQYLLIEDSLKIAVAHNALGQIGIAKAWVKAAKWMNNIAMGGGDEMFEIQYRKSLESIRTLNIVE